jgi:hypothetical protein
MTNAAASHESAETRKSYADVVWGTHGKKSKQYDAVRHHLHVYYCPCQKIVNGKV